jgi:hypothetical protein
LPCDDAGGREWLLEIAAVYLPCACSQSRRNSP